MKILAVQHGLIYLGLVLFVSLAGCATPTPLPTASTATPTPTVTRSASTASTSNAQAATPSAGETSDREVDGAVVDVDAALPPVGIRLSSEGDTIPVEPMGWRITELNGERTTVWTLPEDAAGWHSNSAPVGAQGNVVLSGYQLLGNAVFAPLVLDEVTLGQELSVIDANGQTFLYEIVEIGEPVAISTDPVSERAFAATYLAQNSEAMLTLITGWPEFATTHRLVVRARYIGRQVE